MRLVLHDRVNDESVRNDSEEDDVGGDVGCDGHDDDDDDDNVAELQRAMVEAEK